MEEFQRPQPKQRQLTIIDSIESKIVLDEDKYLEKVEKIIKRDFFPELQQIEELRNGYSYNYCQFASKSYETDRAIQNLSLNEFMETYTSDENKIFVDIVKKEDEKWIEKHQWMFEVEKKHKDRQLAIMNGSKNSKLQNMTDGTRQSHLALADFRALNYLYFQPTDQEKEKSEISRLKQLDNDLKKPKVILENTRWDESMKPLDFEIGKINSKIQDRFKKQLQERLNANGVGYDEFGSTPNLLGIYREQDDENKQILLSELMDGQEKIGRLKEKPAVINGYQMLSMPSPAPERLKSPLMTWGELNETPMRIDRSYNIPKTPPRDQLGSQLALQIGAKKKQSQKRQQEDLKKRLTQMSTPHRMGSVLSQQPSSLLQNFFQLKSGHNSLAPTPISRQSKKIQKH